MTTSFPRDTVFWQSATPEDVQAELAIGSDPHARYKYGLTPLHLAAADNENPVVVQALLEGVMHLRGSGLEWGDEAESVSE